MAARIAKKGNNFYIVFEQPGKNPKWVSVRKELGLNRPAKMKEARELMTRLEAERLNGVFIEPNKVTVGQYLSEWLSNQKPRVKPKTYETWNGVAKNHLIPAIGDIFLSQLRPGKIKSLYAEKLKDGRKDKVVGGLSPRTVQIMHMVLKRALQSAVEDELIRRNVAIEVKPPAQQKPRIVYWTRDQVKCFLDYTGNCVSYIKKIPYPEHHYHTLFSLAITTGMRRGELLGLRWADIDYKKRIIRVRQNLVLTEEEGIIIQDSTKTGVDRDIEVSQKIIDLLKTHHQRQKQMLLTIDRVEHVMKAEDKLIDIAKKHKITIEELLKENGIENALSIKTGYTLYIPKKNYDLVFLSQNGTPVHPRRLDKCLKGLTKRVNDKISEHAKKTQTEAVLLPQLSMHCLRHTYATMMIEQGMDYNTLADRLGHARPSITMDKYGHVTPKMQSRAATMIDDLL